MSILRRLRNRSVATTSGSRRNTASGSERVEASSIADQFRTLLSDSEGSTVFETAITSIFMATLLLMVFSVAMGLVAYQQLGYAVMRSTQHLAYGRGLIADPCATVASDIAASLPAWNTSNFTYTVDITTTSNNQNTDNPYIGATCKAAATSLTNATGGATGNPVTVHVTYTYNWFPTFGDRVTGLLASENTMLVE